MVMQLPEGDVVSRSYKEFLAELDVCMGGRVAEEMIFGVENVTSGASSDLHKATETAKRMVCLYGMSEAVGPIRYGEDEMTSLSEEKRKEIDAEVKKLLQQSYNRARALLEEHKADLYSLANGLIEHETLDAREIRAIIRGEKIRQGSPASGSGKSSSSSVKDKGGKITNQPLLSQQHRE